MSGKLIRIGVCAIVVLCGGIRSDCRATEADAHAAVLALHPDNPHYFTWRGRPTILITSGEHYGAVLNLDFNYERYLDELQANDLNLTRTFSGVYREVGSNFGITENPLAPKPNRYCCPWARSATPGYHEAGNKFDLARWDDAYFARLHAFVSSAARHGVVVEMNLFCPMYKDEMWLASPMNAINNVNGVGSCARTDVYTLKHKDLLDVQLAVTRKIVRELNAMDNVYFEVCNEPYFGGVTMEWQYRIIDEIVRVEAPLPKKHLISMNIANGRKKVEDPHAAVSILNFHYCYPPDVVAMNYGLNRVIGENETGFRGKEDLLYRTEGWDFMLAGGGLYNNLDYSFTASHPDGSLRDYQSPGGGSSALRHQLQILRRFMEALQFVRMRPDDTVLVRRPKGMSAHALVLPREAIAVYIHKPIPKKLKAALGGAPVTTELALKLSPGKYSAEWVNPVTGGVDGSSTFTHTGGPKRLMSPRFDTDIALRVRRKE